ncbi:hypothetical protein CFRS1_v013287 [Colletotrichum fructicola]|nr:hypothetical protein CFRS1_v013287 [Colletotrichum fructicola]
MRRLLRQMHHNAAAWLLPILPPQEPKDCGTVSTVQTFRNLTPWQTPSPFPPPRTYNIQQPRSPSYDVCTGAAPHNSQPN